jgi:LysR family transcriptional regulator, regulator for bpeEF and oprC
MNEIATWMKSFVRVADAGSYSAAAEQLGITQPTVSKQISALERHLGSRLFQRTTRSISLTTEGMLFYEGAMRALAAIEEAQSLVGLAANIQGVVRVTCPLTLAESRMIAMIARFLAAHPQIEIDLKLSDHALNLVSDNLDLAIRVGQFGDNRMTARRIGTARRVLVARPDYLDRVGRPKVPADLRGLNCVSYSLLSSGSRWLFVGGEEVMVRGNMRIDSPNGLRTAALSGIGVAANARWLFEKHLETGELEEVLPNFEPEPMPIHSVLPSGQYVLARTRALLEHLCEEFASDPLLAI